MRYTVAYILLFFLLCSAFAEAQQLSPKGRFTVDYTRGCTPLTISITDHTGTQITYLLQYITSGEVLEFAGNSNGVTTITIANADTITLTQVAESFTDPKDVVGIKTYLPDNPVFNLYACSNLGAMVEIQDRQYDFYDVQFGGGPIIRADASTGYKANGQFASEGNQSVQVQGRYSNAPNNCGSATASIYARPALPPAQITELQWNPEKDSVRLRYSLDPQVRYQLERYSTTAGAYERMALLRNTSTDTLFHQAGLADNYFCYRIRAVDDCAGSATVSSAELCTAAWSVQAAEGNNLIQYSTHSSFSGEIQLLNSAGSLISSSTATSGSFEDADVFCGQNYCYQLRLLPQGANGAYSSSTPLCTTASRSQPLPPLSNIASYWNASQLVVLPQLPGGAQNFQYSLLNTNGMIIEAARGDSLTFNTSPGSECYSLSHADACGNKASQASPFCPLYLHNLSTEPDIFEAGWNAYEGYQQGVQAYVLQELNGNYSVINEWNVGTDTHYTDFLLFSPEDNGRRFRVMAQPAEADLRPSYSNIFIFELRMQGYFPTAFSPNGDGVNDEFKVLGKFVEHIRLQVYNRWGMLIFTSDNMESGWDGTYNGNKAPTGAYVYKALLTTSDGKQSTMTGTVLLTR